MEKNEIDCMFQVKQVDRKIRRVSLWNVDDVVSDDERSCGGRSLSWCSLSLSNTDPSLDSHSEVLHHPSLTSDSIHPKGRNVCVWLSIFSFPLISSLSVYDGSHERTFSRIKKLSFEEK